MVKKNITEIFNEKLYIIYKHQKYNKKLLTKIHKKYMIKPSVENVLNYQIRTTWLLFLKIFENVLK